MFMWLLFKEAWGLKLESVDSFPVLRFLIAFDIYLL